MLKNPYISEKVCMGFVLKKYILFEGNSRKTYIYIYTNSSPKLPLFYLDKYTFLFIIDSRLSLE